MKKLNVKNLSFVLTIVLLLFITVSCDLEALDETDDGIIEQSGFVSGDDGWIIEGDAQQGSGVSPLFSDKDGLNNSGYIYANDDAAGGIWYFIAPSKYLGNLSSCFNGKMRFWLIQKSSMSDQFKSKDIIIASDSKAIYYYFSSYPQTEWTEYNIPLDDSGNWFIGNNEEASNADIKEVLENVTKISIRGEFEVGPDTGGLDQFELIKP